MPEVLESLILLSPHRVGLAPIVRASSAVATEPAAPATAAKMAMRTMRDTGRPMTS